MLRDILSRYTDDDHPLSAGELADLLAEQGIWAERKSVYSDRTSLPPMAVMFSKPACPSRGSAWESGI